ncbi:sugar kinase [Longibaculum muris]|uniref:sugar kinase n=1 Tax=Longibaculum muris TaxID=1796628 RepID=UPI002943CA0B|nr:sugar kinase [Longibaculum muris]
MKVLCMGETLLRYSTQKGHRISELDFQVHVGGSETNIAVSLAQFGFETTLLTKLPHHALGDAVISCLKRFGVDTTKIIRNDMRIGSYFLENGSGNRSSQVIYDRQYSAMTSFSLNDIKLEELFLDVDVFVVSGITAALNQSVREAIIEMLRYCRGNKITVVYDSNYRAKMWSIEEAGAALKEILPYVDILSAGYLDAQNFLGITSDKESFEERLNEVYMRMKEVYPHLKYITSTRRDILSTSVNDLTGYLYSDKLYVSKTYHIDDIVDRVGGGDAYLSGLLYGLLNGKDLKYSLEFGCCASVLKHTIHGDANTFSVEEIENFMESGTSRINR